MRGGQPQRMTGRRAMTLFVALRLCCAGCSRSKTTSDGCISRRRDQVQQVGWSVAVQAPLDHHAQYCSEWGVKLNSLTHSLRLYTTLIGRCVRQTFLHYAVGKRMLSGLSNPVSLSGHSIQLSRVKRRDSSFFNWIVSRHPCRHTHTHTHTRTRISTIGHLVSVAVFRGAVEHSSPAERHVGAVADCFMKTSQVSSLEFCSIALFPNTV